MILVLLTGEFAHCVHPSPSLNALQLEQRVGRLFTEESEVKGHWAGYFERLYQADPPAVEFDVKGVTLPIADPPTNCDPPSFVETQAGVTRLKWVKAPGIYCIHAELLKAGENAVIMLLHAALCSAWNTDINPTDWKMGHVVPLCKGEG